MATYLVTGITLGAAGGAGLPRVRNTAGQVAAFGTDTSVIGNTVLSSGQSGAHVALDLHSAYTPPPATALSMALSGAPLVLGAMGDQARVGSLSIANAAQALYPTGRDGFICGAQLHVSPPADARRLLLELLNAYTPPSAANVGMYLDYVPLAAGLGAITGGAFGTAYLEQPISVRPAGIAPQAPNLPRVNGGGNGASVVLDLSGAYTSPVRPVRMDFTTTARPFAAAGFNALRTGAAVLHNAALSAQPAGAFTARFGPRTFITDAALAQPLALDLVGNYAPPSASAIQMAWAGADKNVSPSTIAAFASGNASLVLVAQGLTTTGADAAHYGSPHVFGASRQLQPEGFDAAGFGDVTVFSTNRTLPLPGFDAFQGFGAATVTLGRRRLYAALGVQTAFGSAAFAGGVRTLYVDTVPAKAVGQPTLTFALRELLPAWFIATLYGDTHVDHTHDVTIAPIAPGAAGHPDVHYPRAIVDMQGAGRTFTAFGEARLGLYTRTIAPAGFMPAQTESGRFGRASAYNLTQYVQQLFLVTPSDGGAFGDFYYVKNRDRAVAPEGANAARYGMPVLTNNARLVRTPMYVDFSVFGDTSVAYAIRTLAVRGAQADEFGSPLGNVVYNAARVLAPSPIAPGALGRPSRVWSNLQSLRYAGGGEASVFGNALVAYAVRGIDIAPPLRPPPFGNVTVQNLARYVRPSAVNDGGRGVPSLTIHFTIIAPAATLPPNNAFGEGRVHNVTPELGVYGWTATMHGATAVHNQFERYAFQGFGSTLFGRHVVDYRRKIVAPRGVDSFVLLNRHAVRNVTPSPPGPHALGLAGSAQTHFGLTVLRYNTFYPRGITTDDRFGRPSLVASSILPRGILPPYSDVTGVQCGTPLLNAVPRVFPKGIGAPLASLHDVGPRYIWAPRGYPYTTGYWSDEGEQMDQRVFGRSHPERPVFGRPNVTHFNRAVRAYGDQFERIGQPWVSPRPIHVLGEGRVFQKFGYPRINGGGGVYPYGFDMALLGAPALVFPEQLNRPIYPAGFDALRSDVQDAQNFNRSLGVQGFDTFTVSIPVAPSWPRRSTWVSNAYPPFPIAGADTSVFGTTWVSNYIRHLDLEGADTAMVAADSYGAFAERMRVFKLGKVLATGDITGAFGAAMISNARRAPQLAGVRAGAPGTPALSYVLHLAGFDSAAYGDLQRWEAGKLKPYGPDLAAYGRAVIGRILRPPGAAGAVGAPRLSRTVAAGGDSTAKVATPTLTAFGCGDHALAYHGDDASAYGSPEVAHA